MSDVIRISECKDWIVDYDKERGMYRVSYFKDNHFVDECWFDCYEEKEVTNKTELIGWLLGEKFRREKMQIDIKLQIEAIKGNSLYYAEYGKLVFISDGKIGVYLNESELKIDKTKMKKISNPDIFDPQNLVKERVRAKETDIARKGVRSFYIKLKSPNLDNFCYVDETFLKMFPKYGDLLIKGENDLVYIEKYGQPYGAIMPVHVRKEEE